MGFKNFTAIVVLLVGFIWFLDTIGLVDGVEKIWPAFLILWALGTLFGDNGLHTMMSNDKKSNKKK